LISSSARVTGAVPKVPRCGINIAAVKSVRETNEGDTVTELKEKVRRKVTGVMRKDLVVTLYPNNTLGLRQLRCKKEFLIPIMSCYNLAIAADRAAAKREKEIKKKFGRS